MNHRLCFLLFIMSTGPITAASAQKKGNTISNVHVDTITYYDVALKSGRYLSDCINGDDRQKKMKYFADCEEISRERFNEIVNANSQVAWCDPCYVKIADKEGRILRGGLQYSDCTLDSSTEFQLSHRYEITGKAIDYYGEIEEPLKDYCPVPDGIWTFYNAAGEIKYEEHWLKGQFIRQVPEQQKAEVWKAALTLNGMPAEKQVLLPGQLKDLQLTPYFKSAGRDSLNLTYRLNITVPWRFYYKQEFTPDSLKAFDLNKLVRESGLNTSHAIIYVLEVLNNQKPVARFNLNFLTDLPGAPPAVSIPKHDVFLVNSANTTKKRRLSTNYSYWLYLTDSTEDTLSNIKNMSMNANILRKNRSLLSLEIYSESIEIEFKNGESSSIQKSYYNTKDEMIIRELNIGNLKSIEYYTPTRSFFTGFAAFTGAISVTTALVVAPLISINYKNGDFNKKLYYKVAGISLASLAVIIPLGLASVSRTFYITEKNIKKGKEFWFIESVPGK